jgi:[ribosomal protein S18]-alanine N-acetyltransferase
MLFKKSILFRYHLINKSDMFRQATDNDIGAIDGINRANMPENYTHKTYEIHFQLAPTLNWVVTSEEPPIVVGYIVTQIEDRVEAHITSIAVDDKHRRKGLGKRLLLNMLLSAKKLNLLSCSLHVRISNEGAIKLYEGMKFIKVRVKKRYYEDDEDAFLMRRRL